MGNGSCGEMDQRLHNPDWVYRERVFDIDKLQTFDDTDYKTITEETFTGASESSFCELSFRMLRKLLRVIENIFAFY